MYPREKYLKSIRPFYGSDIIKVITGIRRSGKAFIIRAILNELLASGVEESRIVYIPLDTRGFKSIDTPDALEERIDSEMHGDGFHYLVIDEVQNVKGFEPIVQAYAEEGVSLRARIHTCSAMKSPPNSRVVI